MANIFQQFGALFKLPSQLKRTAQSQQQASNLGNQVASLAPPQPAQPSPVASSPITQPSAQSFPSQPQPTQPTAPPQVNQPMAQPNFQQTLDEVSKQAKAIQESFSNFQEKQTGEDALRGAEEQLLAAQQQSPEEQSSQARLDALAGQYRLGQANIQDKPIALEFITGQQRALENRAAALSEPIERQLARFQAERQLRIQGAETGLGIAEARRGRAIEAEKMAQPDLLSVSESKALGVPYGTTRAEAAAQGIIPQEDGRESTQTERDRALRTVILSKAEPILNASRKPDGTIDVSKYLELQAQFAAEFGDTRLFDQLFATQLSVEDRNRLLAAGRIRLGATVSEIGLLNPFE